MPAVFIPVMIVHWQDLGYLYRPRNLTNIFRLAFLDEILGACSNGMVRGLDMLPCINTWQYLWCQLQLHNIDMGNGTKT